MGSHKNKVMREKLEAKYGKGCMFRNAGIEKRIEAMGGIKTYKEYIKEHRYTLKKIIQLEGQLTYHHLVHRSEGGSTTEENGANVNALAHGYSHSLPRNQEEIINNMLREYKRNIDLQRCDKTSETELKKCEPQGHKCRIEFVDEIGVDLCRQHEGFEGLDLVYTEVDFTQQLEKKKEKFNRAKQKRQTQKEIEEEFEDERY